MCFPSRAESHCSSSRRSHEGIHQDAGRVFGVGEEHTTDDVGQALAHRGAACALSVRAQKENAAPDCYDAEHNQDLEKISNQLRVFRKDPAGRIVVGQQVRCLTVASIENSAVLDSHRGFNG